MEKPTRLGNNRTGIDISPIDGKALIDEAKRREPSSEGDALSLLEIRESYIVGAEPVGKIPVPGTLKGVVVSGAQKIAGRHPETLIDKLGQRLAFERAGTRLYEALLMKLEVTDFESSVTSIEELRRFRDEEAKHMAWIHDAMRSVGADPTAQTPCADTDGVASSGLLKVISDPRTSPAQCFEALLIAELADRDGWDLLIALADGMGQEKMAEQFRQAFAEEAVHLETIRSAHQELVLGDAGAAAA